MTMAAAMQLWFRRLEKENNILERRWNYCKEGSNRGSLSEKDIQGIIGSLDRLYIFVTWECSVLVAWSVAAV